jgi:hypothetical protein
VRYTGPGGAVVEALLRGIKVEVVLDKSQPTQK